MSIITILNVSVTSYEAASVEANFVVLKVKPTNALVGGRSQNRRLQKGLPA